MKRLADILYALAVIAFLCVVCTYMTLAHADELCDELPPTIAVAKVSLDPLAPIAIRRRHRPAHPLIAEQEPAAVACVDIEPQFSPVPLPDIPDANDLPLDEVAYPPIQGWPVPENPPTDIPQWLPPDENLPAALYGGFPVEGLPPTAPHGLTQSPIPLRPVSVRKPMVCPEVDTSAAAGALTLLFSAVAVWRGRR